MTETEKRLSDMGLAEIRDRASGFAEWCKENEPRFHRHEYQGQLDRSALLSHIAAISTPSQENVERARELLAYNCERLGFTVWAEGVRKQEEQFYFANPSEVQMAKLAIDAISQALTEPAPDISGEASSILRTLGGVPDTTDLSETDAKVSVGFLRRLLAQPAQGTSVDAVEAMREAAAKVVLDMHGEDYATMTGAVAVRLRNQIVAKAIRALPLPVSANGSAKP